MKITSKAYSHLKDYCISTYPKQACGILISDGEKLFEHIPMQNVGAWPYGFQFDELEQMRILKAINKRELRIGTIYHAHLTSKAYPTAKDVSRHYYEDILCGVISMLNDFDFKVYSIIENKICAEALEII